MKGPVSKSELGRILMPAKLAAKNVRAQRDRLLQLQLKLLSPAAAGADGAGAALLSEVASGVIDVSYRGIEIGARCLCSCLKLAARNGVPPSLPYEFAAISDAQLFDRLVALRLPRRPVTQAQAIARVEAAAYAVKLNQEHCLLRCIQHLGYRVSADTDDEDESSKDSLPDTNDEDSQDGGEIGLPDPVTADQLATTGLSEPETTATEDLAKIGLSDPDAVVTDDLAKIGLSNTDAAAIDDLAKITIANPDATVTELTEGSSKIGLPAPATDAATGESETPQAASIDLDQARTYLDRACTLANLAVKHIDLAVTTISSCLDPKEVADISSFVDLRRWT